MKSLFFSLFFISLLSACSSKKTATVSANTPKDSSELKVAVGKPMQNDINSFLSGFEAATLSHNPQRILPYMQKDYKVEQHDKFLEGNTTQFLNEFFSGYDAQSKTWEKVDYLKIDKMTRLDLKPTNGYYSVSYALVTGGKTIHCNWTLMVKLDGANLVYGLYGPVG